jgi:hypothetical protein
MFEQTLGGIFGQNLDEFKSMLNPVARAIQVSQRIKIADWTGAPRASVIFVHGLGGHAYHYGNPSKGLAPDQLPAELPNIEGDANALARPLFLGG